MPPPEPVLELNPMRSQAARGTTPRGIQIHLADSTWSLLPSLALPMPLVLSPATDPDTGGPLAISLAGITPDRLTGLALDTVKRLAITADERPAELGELFSISGDAADSMLECRGDFSRVHFVGAGMAAGTIRVMGSVGRHAAEGMTGGRLEAAGDAGDWLAAEMSGGEVMISGSAGDNLAAALPGSDHGLRGGMVVVRGDAGCLAGQRMRRGIVAVGGSCGTAAAFEMRAGTVLVAGCVGPHPGLGMRRGSLVALTAQPAIPATFHRGRTWLPPFIGLQVAALRRAGFRPASPIPARFRQWHGDTVAGGRGEILAPEPF